MKYFKRRMCLLNFFHWDYKYMLLNLNMLSFLYESFIYRYMAWYVTLWWILYNIEKQRKIPNFSHNGHFVLFCMCPVIWQFQKFQSIKIPFQMFKWQCYTLYNAFFRVFINSKIIARDKPVFISQKVKICNSINFQIINTYIIWVLKYIDIFYL